MGLPGNALVRPFELRLWWDERAVTRYRLWTVRVVLVLLLLDPIIGAAYSESLAGLFGSVLGVGAVVLLIGSALLRPLSTHVGPGDDPDDQGMEGIYCRSCGHESDPANVHCPECGHEIREPVG
jgi:hypothetical protein